MGTASLAAGSTIPVLDQLWPGTTFVSVAPSTGVSGVSCNATASPLAFSVTLATALAAGTEATNGAKFTITIVAPLTALQDAFTNYVSVAGTGTPPTPGQTCLIEQCASVGTRLAYPGMQMTKTGPATVVAGSTITYTIRLGNNGTDSILNGTVVLVNDKLPLGDTFVYVAPVAGVADPVPCNASQTGLVTCSVKLTADLVNGTAPADGPAFNITATVDPLYVGDSTNHASIAPDGVSMPPTQGPPLCLGPNCGSTTVAVWSDGGQPGAGQVRACHRHRGDVLQLHPQPGQWGHGAPGGRDSRSGSRLPADWGDIPVRGARAGRIECGVHALGRAGVVLGHAGGEPGQRDCPG
jgi:uncharacterized repeat protein (TIGR01451 family)